VDLAVSTAGTRGTKIAGEPRARVNGSTNSSPITPYGSLQGGIHKVLDANWQENTAVPVTWGEACNKPKKTT